MSTHAAHLDTTAFDAAAVKAQEARESAGSWLKRLTHRIAERQQAVAMARIAAIDPRLAREIRAARDRADW